MRLTLALIASVLCLGSCAKPYDVGQSQSALCLTTACGSPTPVCPAGQFCANGCCRDICAAPCTGFPGNCGAGFLCIHNCCVPEFKTCTTAAGTQCSFPSDGTVCNGGSATVSGACVTTLADCSDPNHCLKPGLHFWSTCKVNGPLDTSCGLPIYCGPGYADCDGDILTGCETDLTDVETCGACNTKCSNKVQHATTKSCKNTGLNTWTCDYAACTSTFGDCDGDRTNGCETSLLGNNSHCGDCNTACGGSTATCCGSSCVDLNTDENNCGGCGNPCSPGLTCCGGVCMDTTSDAAHCGDCKVCSSSGSSSTSCIAGVCTPVCDATHASCDSNPANGCEQTTDVNHCGNMSCSACDTAQSNPSACTNHVCQYTCKPGFVNCDKSGNDANGCETTENAAHCGASCTACPVPAHAAAAACSAGACDYTTCSSGFGDCDANRGNGCETNTNTDVNNCGGCGNVCPTPAFGAPTCVGGVCGAACIMDAAVTLKVCVNDMGASNCGQCCSDADCMTPPDKCHETQGTCGAGFCQYALKVCTVVDCYSAPTCNLNTGNCDSNPLSGGSCGGSKCYVGNASGTCQAGTCVDGSGNPLQTVDCSTGLPVCKIGVCAKNGECSSEDAVNGTACTLNDKCQLTPSCMNGTCSGTPRSCTTDKICRVSSCNSSTGDCDEQIAVAGTACTSGDPCRQNEACDDQGNCAGQPRPDGNPCPLADCTTGGICLAGTCSCADSIDMSMSQSPPDLAEAPKGNDKSGDCAMAGRGAPKAPALLVLFSLVAVLRSRRPRRARRR